MSGELRVLCGELVESVYGTVPCGAEMATVADDDQQVVLGPQALAVAGQHRLSAVLPCHGVAANEADLRFMYDDLEYRGVAWVRFDGTVIGTTDSGTFTTELFR